MELNKKIYGENYIIKIEEECCDDDALLFVNEFLKNYQTVCSKEEIQRKSQKENKKNIPHSKIKPLGRDDISNNNSGNNAVKKFQDLKKQREVISSIITELKFRKKPIIHNFIPNEYLKNHNIKLGIQFSIDKNSFILGDSDTIMTKNLAGIIYDIMLWDMEFENLTFFNPYFCSSPKPNSSLNKKQNIVYSKKLIAFMFYNNNFFNYKNIKGLMIDKIFVIYENYMDINVL